MGFQFFENYIWNFIIKYIIWYNGATVQIEFVITHYYFLPGCVFTKQNEVYNIIINDLIDNVYL